MAIHPFYLADQRLLVTRIHGVLDDAGLVRYYQGVCASATVGLDVPELVDLTGISLRSPVTKMGFRQVSEVIAAAYGPNAEPAASASVAPNILVYGMMRMYEIGYASDTVHVRVFRTFDAALDWLERDRAVATLVPRLDPAHPSFIAEIAVPDPPVP